MKNCKQRSDDIMQNKEKLLSFLGLAARAGKIISGEELVIKGIQSGKINLVILSNDASENTTKKIMNKCDYYQIPYKIMMNRNELGHAIGKISRVVLGVADKGFANHFLHLSE